MFLYAHPGPYNSRAKKTYAGHKCTPKAEKIGPNLGW